MLFYIKLAVIKNSFIIYSTQSAEDSRQTLLFFLFPLKFVYISVTRKVRFCHFESNTEQNVKNEHNIGILNTEQFKMKK